MSRLKLFLAVVGVMFGTLLASPVIRADFLYVTDGSNNNTDKVSQPSGSTSTISSFATGTTSPQGVAVDQTDTYAYVTNNSTGAINRILVSTGAVTTNVVTGLSGPIGVAIDSSNNLYVVNSGSGTVGKYTVNANGSLSTVNASFISTTSALSGPAQYVAVDSTGVYVTSQFATIGLGTLAKYNASTGALITATGTNFTDNVEGLKVGVGTNAGSILVADTSATNGTIQKFNSTTLGSQTTFATLTNTTPWGVATDTNPSSSTFGNLYVTNNGGSSATKLFQISPTGTVTALTLSGSISVGTLVDVAQAPEPSSLLLTGLGVGVLGAYRRYRSRKSAVAQA